MPTPLTADEFAALMAPLGPWPTGRRVAVAVSGGADSLCLALLAARWGQPVALIVDHGLRPESALEARRTSRRLAALAIPVRVLVLRTLRQGAAISARARTARYAALIDAARAEGCVDLLLAHHRRDQAETVLMRRDAGSGGAGLAGMAPIVETDRVRIVRPLLNVPPGRLRATLAAHGVAWIEDPTNQNLAYLRPRLRAGLADTDGDGAAVTELAGAARAASAARVTDERAAAACLAAMADIRPEGFAILRPGAVPPPALSMLIRAIAGAAYPASPKQVARLAVNPRPAVLHGVRFLAAGRLGPGLLLVREPRAMQAAVPAVAGAVWDGRFRLPSDAAWPADARFGAVGEAAACLRAASDLPAAVLRTLPAIWHDGVLVSVPHISYPANSAGASMAVWPCPPNPVAGAPFSAPV